METVSALVGKDAYAAVPLQDLEQDTMRYLIANKLFNYSEETSLRALSDSSLFKTLVTGGNITIRQLYAQPYIAENRTKLIISANQLPQTRDTSNGLLRRLAIIKMEAVFNPEVEGHDYFIKDKLMAELPGIYNLLIEAYGRLKERGMLAGTEIIKEALQEYREETDGECGSLTPPFLMFPNCAIVSYPVLKNCISTFSLLLYFNILKSPDNFDLNTFPTQSL